MSRKTTDAIEILEDIYVRNPTEACEINRELERLRAITADEWGTLPDAPHSHCLHLRRCHAQTLCGRWGWTPLRQEPVLSRECKICRRLADGGAGR